MGPDGDEDHDAEEPVVAAGMHNWYLTAWHGNPGTAPMSKYEDEIFGRFFTTHPLNFIPIVVK
jgi:hypothetical protein